MESPGWKHPGLFLCASALPFKGRVGWGWVPIFVPTSNLVIQAKTSHLVVPAKAGTQCLFFGFGFSRQPTHVPVFSHSPSLASESLLFACPKRSNQEKGHPGWGASAARRFAASLLGRPSPPHTGPEQERPLPPSAPSPAARGKEFIGWALAHRLLAHGWKSGGPRPTL